MSKTILIVDDDPSARHVLSDILKAEGYLVLQASEGGEALTLLSSQPVHMVITDRAMPGMDGLALLEAIQRRQLGIPTLMISAYGEEKLWGQAIGLGAQDYILKPYNTREVVKLVKKTLGGKTK